MDQVLTVAFVLAVVAFFKEQFGLSGKAALLAAFVVSAVVGFLPLLAASFPAAAPWIDAFVKMVVLFLSAAGGYDFVVDVKNKLPG